MWYIFILLVFFRILALEKIARVCKILTTGPRLAEGRRMTESMGPTALHGPLKPIGLDIMFVASSCERLPSLFKICLWLTKMTLSRMSHVLFVEVLHPVNFVNMAHVKS